MSHDRDISHTFAVGRRNQEVKELIQNWCGHARVEKYGGTGVIEMQTGYPVGHHMMACDHASAGGFATWYLEDSALQFHDRYCVGCTLRIPVRLPNLSKLVSQRDNDLARARQDELEDQKRALADYELREQARNRLRGSGSAPREALLDDLAQFDRERSNGVRARIIETARLAPELFTGDIANYLFEVIEVANHWLDDVGLTVLKIARADRTRLTRCAIRSLTDGDSLQTAAAIVADNADLVDAADVSDIVPALAYVATPALDRFGQAQEQELPEPLLIIYRKFQREVITSIDALLNETNPLIVDIAVRAIGVLIHTDQRALQGFAKSLLARLVRIDTDLESDSGREVDRIANALVTVSAAAFFADPQLLNAEIARYYEGASLAGEARLAAIYEEVLRRGALDRDEEPISDLEPYRVALRQLLSLYGSTTNDKVLSELLSAMRAGPRRLIDLARQERDLLFGATAILDTRLEQQDTEPQLAGPNQWLADMERQSLRSTLYYLREATIHWVAQGASAADLDIQDYVSLLSHDHRLSESLRANLVRELPPLMQTATGMNTVLPTLYSAMVSRSTRERAAAARVIRELGTKRVVELPSLVLDTFVLLLLDRYKAVHQAAVTALHRFRLPDEYAPKAASILWQLIHCYRTEKGEDSFRLECIYAFVRLQHDQPQFAAEIAPVLVALLHEINPSELTRERNGWLLRKLAAAEGFAELIVGLLRDADTKDINAENVLEALHDIPAPSLRTHVQELLTIAKDRIDDTMTVATLMETFTAHGVWDAAEAVAQMRWKSIPDTVRMRPRKLDAQLRMLTTEFERLVSEGRIADALALGEQWGQVTQLQNEVRRTE